MRLRLIREAQDAAPAVAAETGQGWVPVRFLPGITDETSQSMVAFLEYAKGKAETLQEAAEHASAHALPDASIESMLPFRPVLFRDFMLTEAHMVSTTRNMAKRFMPGAYAVGHAFEVVTRHTFPPFKPSHEFTEHPLYYKGNHLQMIGDGEQALYPDYATVLDYELELGFIITRSVRNCTPEEGLSAIGGFCIVDDFSARNVQIAEMRHTGTGPCKTKDFATGMSDIVVTPDEVLPYLGALKGRVSIDGVELAEGTVGGFGFSLGEAVAYASEGETVYPGELMATGTIPGCCGIENGILLKRGDSIRLEIDRIGSLENTIA